MIGSQDLDAFIRTHQWAVLTTLRRDGSPAGSVVGYAVDGDDLLVAADETSLKIRCLELDPRVALCAFSDDAQPRFVTIEGRATIEREGSEEAKRLVFSTTVPRGHAGAGIAAWLKRPATLIIRARPERVWGVLNPTA